MLLEAGEPLAFSFEDMMRYHGPGSPGGVAHAFKVLERVLPELGDGAAVERRALAVRTAFEGPGARDGFELVTRAVTDGRYEIDPSLARPERGIALERFVFRLDYRDSSVTLVLREGFVTEDFIALTRAEGRSADEERRLGELKIGMAERIMSAPAAAVYEVTKAC